VAMLPRQHGRGMMLMLVMMLLSHVGDDAAEVT
jgi:hypothetical protein